MLQASLHTRHDTIVTLGHSFRGSLRTVSDAFIKGIFEGGFQGSQGWRGRLLVNDRSNVLSSRPPLHYITTKHLYDQPRAWALT